MKGAITMNNTEKNEKKQEYGWKLFKFLLTGYRYRVDHNEVTPQEARIFNKYYSDALKKCDPDLYADMERIAKSEKPEGFKS